MGEDRDRTKVDSLPLTCPVCGMFIIGMEAIIATSLAAA